MYLQSICSTFFPDTYTYMFSSDSILAYGLGLIQVAYC